MGTIICQDCQCVIKYFDGEKVAILYGTCPNCNKKKKTLKR